MICICLRYMNEMLANGISLTEVGGCHSIALKWSALANESSSTENAMMNDAWFIMVTLPRMFPPNAIAMITPACDQGSITRARLRKVKGAAGRGDRIS